MVEITCLEDFAKIKLKFITKGDRQWISSRDIAALLGESHKKVKNDIRNILLSLQLCNTGVITPKTQRSLSLFCSLNFELDNSTGKTKYFLTKDGLEMFLACSKNPIAMAFKVAYIGRFH